MIRTKLNRNLRLLLITNVLISLDNGLISPLFPLFLYGLKADTIQIGWVLSLGGIAAAVTVLPAGLLADRFRRRNLLVAGSIITLISCVLLSLISSWEHSIIGFILLNIAFTLIYPAAITMAADNSENESATVIYGIMNATWVSGMVVGPIISGLLADSYGWNSVFYLAVLISVFSIAPSFWLRRTRHSQVEKQELNNVKGKFFTRNIILPLAVFSLSQCFLSASIGTLNLIIPLHLTKFFFLDQAFVGFFLSTGQVATLLAQISSGLLAKGYNSRKIMTLSLYPLPLLPLLWLLAGNYSLLFIVNILIFGLWGMTWPVAQDYLINLSPKLMRGRTISINETLARVGFTIGPLLGGYIWGFFGAAFSFIASSIFFVLALFLILFLKKIGETA